MQELIDIIKQRINDDDSIPYMYNERILELAESLLEKEKEVMVDFAYKFGDEPLAEIAKWYDKQFNTEEEEIHPDSVYGQWMKRMNGE